MEVLKVKCRFCVNDMIYHKEIYENMPNILHIIGGLCNYHLKEFFKWYNNLSKKEKNKLLNKFLKDLKMN
ncbi:MAG: hypothetical protein ACFFG0_08110 [Candidatus Thorarchaeota archaeon]